jgi:hypothetical protein
LPPAEKSAQGIVVFTWSQKTLNPNPKSKNNWIKTSSRGLKNYDPFVFTFKHGSATVPKEILDQHSLPKEIYQKFKSRRLNLPKYQWTIVDAKTKTRFLAWSHALTSFYGLKFLQIVILWLRAHNIQNQINARMDGGAEFFSASQRKLQDWNEQLKPLGAGAEWTGGAKWKNNLVERTHRIDDEEFYCPRGGHINNFSDFLVEGQYWNFYYNNRCSDGIGMDGMSPKDKLDSLGIYNADRICRFPILILDDLFNPLLETFPQVQSQNVLTYYLMVIYY